MGNVTSYHSLMTADVGGIVNLTGKMMKNKTVCKFLENSSLVKQGRLTGKY